MLIAAPSLMLLFLAVIFSVRSKEVPMDRDVILRIRRFAEDVRREQFLPYD